MASTPLNEQGVHPDLIELQLAHAERNTVRSAYNRAQRLAERRQMTLGGLRQQTESGIQPVGDRSQRRVALLSSICQNAAYIHQTIEADHDLAVILGRPGGITCPTHRAWLV